MKAVIYWQIPIYLLICGIMNKARKFLLIRNIFQLLTFVLFKTGSVKQIISKYKFIMSELF